MLWVRISPRALCHVLKLEQDTLHSALYWFIWFDLILYVQVSSYGHVRTVSSPNHTFFLGKLDLVVNQYFVHILSFVTDNNPS